MPDPRDPRSLYGYYGRQEEDAVRMYTGAAANRQHRRLEMLRAAIGDVPSAADVLDIGCGDGYARERVLPGVDPERYLGVDLSVPKLRASLTRLPGSAAVQADAEHLPIGSECIDWVVCSEVLEHLPDPASALREITRVLRPGGHVAIATPVDSVAQRLWHGFRSGSHADGAADSDFHEHIQLFTPRRLRALLAGAGLEVVSIRYCAFHVPVLDKVLDSLPYASYAAADGTLSRLPFHYTCVGTPLTAFGSEYGIVLARKPAAEDWRALEPVYEDLTASAGSDA